MIKIKKRKEILNVKSFIEKKINKLIKKDEKLIFLTLFGSHLYGTATKTSDIDIKGIFLPSKRDLILNKASHHKNFSTNTVDKNTKEDVDIELFSIHKFLEKICAGDAVNTDLFFALFSSFASLDSFSLYKNEKICKKILEIKDFIISTNMRGYVGFSLSQIRRYSQKSEKAFVLKEFIKILNSLDGVDFEKIENLPYKKWIYCLKTTYPQIKEYINERKINGRIYIEITSKKYDTNIRLKDFKILINDLYNRFGERAKKNITDWKSLTHGYRTVWQCLYILQNKHLLFPLPKKVCSHLLMIKNGKISKEKVVSEIEKIIEKIDKIIETRKYKIAKKPKISKVEELIIKLYEH